MLELILGIFIGFTVGLIVVGFMSVKTINDYIEQNSNLLEDKEMLINKNGELKEVRIQTEARISNLIKLVRNIIKTVKEAEVTHEFAVETLNKIKKVVWDYQSQN